MTQEMLFSKYAEQYPLTVPQEAVENELQLLILEEKQRIQYETLTGFAVHLSPQEELNKKMEALQAEALRRAKEMLVLREIMAAQTFPVTPEELERKLTLLNDALEKTMRTEDISCIREVLHRVVPTFHEPEEVNAAQGETVEIPGQEPACS